MVLLSMQATIAVLHAFFDIERKIMCYSYGADYSGNAG